MFNQLRLNQLNLYKFLKIIDNQLIVHIPKTNYPAFHFQHGSMLSTLRPGVSSALVPKRNAIHLPTNKVKLYGKDCGP